jgi:hypothetical protein
MRIYFNKGFKLYEQKLYKQAKYFFNEIKNFSNIVKEKLNFIDPDDKDDYDDIIESTNFYIKRIKTINLINEGDVYFEKAIFNSESIDMDLLYLSLDNYREAYNIILEKTDLYKVLKTKDAKEIYKLANQSVRLGLSLFPKNVSNEKWYIEISSITQEIRNQIQMTEEISESTLNIRIIEENPQIFDEINNKFNNENEIDFILFCLKKYPYKNYDKKNDEEIKKNYSEYKKKFLNNLISKYHPDNYENNTQEEKIKKLIMTEIYKKLNKCYEIYIGDNYSNCSFQTPSVI